MHLCRVIVVGRMPLDLPFFDYSVPSELQTKLAVGQLLSVPFRGKQHSAVAIAFPKTPPVRNGKLVALKPITAILNNQPAFSEAYLNFLAEMADFYAVSPGFLLKSAFFELTKKNIAMFGALTFEPFVAAPAIQHKPTLFVHHTEEEKKNHLLHSLDPQGQNLILVPEVNQATQTAQLLFGDVFEEKATILTSETKNTAISKLWFKIWQQEPLTLVATRRALFLPWKSLQNIFLTDEGSPSYKSWDMAPRFETRDAVFLLQRHLGAQTHLMSPTPSVESFFFAKKKVYAFASSQEMPFTSEKTELIDLKDEQRGGNYGFFADESLAALRTGLQSGNVFILSSHRGSVSSVACRDCSFVPRCGVCVRPFSYHEDTKELVCHFCGTRKPMLLQCENCRGTDLAARGIGTQKVERELRRKLKDLVDTVIFVRIDSDSEAVPVFEAGKPHIIIGTERALGFIDWSKITCTLLIDPDTLLFIPEYKIAERLWQTIRGIEYASPEKARLLVQTKHSEHVVFNNLKRPERFYVKELQQRKFFGYPPFNFILKLSFGHQFKDASEREANRLFSELTRLTAGRKDCIITHPLATAPAFFKKRSWHVILVKVDYRNYKRTVKELLKHVPDTWKVDPNPQSLLGF